MIIVKDTRINTGEKIYQPGEVIHSLTEEEEQRLVDAGHCEFPLVDKPYDGIKHLGGGYYELPNGEKVRGKDKATAALEELNKESDETPNDEDGPQTGLPKDEK